MRLILIRHAESEGNVAVVNGADRADVIADPPLTDLGLRQVRALADWLPGRIGPVEAVYHSPYLRARQSAEPLAATLGVGVRVCEDAAEVAPTEPRPQTVERLWRLRDWLRDQPEDSTIPLVSHGVFSSLLLNALLDPRVLERADQQSDRYLLESMHLFPVTENSATSALRLDAEFVHVEWLNRVDHLDAAGLRGQGAGPQHAYTSRTFDRLANA